MTLYTVTLVTLVHIQSCNNLHQGFRQKFLFCTKVGQSYIPNARQSTMMDQSYSISVEGLKHVAPQSSNDSSKVGHLVFLLGQWWIIKYPNSYSATSAIGFLVAHILLSNH